MRLPMSVILLAAAVAAGAEAPGWRRVALSPSLSVSLPRGAKLIQHVTREEEGGPSWVYKHGLVTYEITSIDAKPKDVGKANPDELLAAIAEASLDDESKPALKFQKDVLLKGWPGLESLSVGNDDVADRQRVFMVGSHFYKLEESYYVPKGQPAGTDAFFESLVITPSPKPGPFKRPGPVFTAYRPEGGQLEIGMPRKPELERSHMGDSGSGPLLTHCAATYGNRTYTVSYVDIPADSTSDEVKQGIREGILEDFKAKHVRSATVTREAQSFEVCMFTGAGGMAGRLEETAMSGRIYLILMVYPQGHAGSPDIDEFFNSFRVLP